MKMTKENIARGLGIGQKADSSTSVGNKVLPINDSALSTSTNVKDERDVVEKKDKPKGDKTKTVSRMKELLRWAAAAKSDKGAKYLRQKVLYFRNRTTLKSVPDDDQLSNDSPKISFRWEVESCSTSSSAISAATVASLLKNDQTHVPHNDQSSSRRGNWITTDSEFVVLEL